MQENYSIFSVPSFARAETFDFSGEKSDFEAYEELNKISEEIERWRAENC